MQILGSVVMATGIEASVVDDDESRGNSSRIAMIGPGNLDTGAYPTAGPSRFIIYTLHLLRSGLNTEDGR